MIVGEGESEYCSFFFFFSFFFFVQEKQLYYLVSLFVLRPNLCTRRCLRILLCTLN
jgi:hypothetical protein